VLVVMVKKAGRIEARCRTMCYGWPLLIDASSRER
jgi:hypothetical protein